MIILDDDGNRIYAKYFNNDLTKPEQVNVYVNVTVLACLALTFWRDQREFEQKLNKKTKGLTARTEGESSRVQRVQSSLSPHITDFHWIFVADILLMDAQIAVFRSGNDTKFFCVGPAEEVGLICQPALPGLSNSFHACQNELIISSVLDTIYDTIATLLRSGRQNLFLSRMYVFG